MVTVRAFAIVAFAAGVLGAAPCRAATADSSGTTYALITPPSSFEVGCQGPCECPIESLPTYGSFQLVWKGADPLYTYYSVERYIASFNNGPGAIAIIGSGQYKVGGEFALVQELTLDLEIEGRPTEHFDSGLQPLRTPFPQINISSAVHGFSCYDSVLVVDARPVNDANAGGSQYALALAAAPNPFTGTARIAFAIPRDGTADLGVFDITGRRVRSLARHEWFASGAYVRVWDGRLDDGRSASAGLYVIRLDSPSGRVTKMLARVN
jgi:hypothetical protein